MSKKILTLFLSISMIIGLLPVTAFANADSTAITVDGHDYTEEQLKQSFVSSGWSWDAEARKIILNNYNGSYIKACRDINIEAKGGTQNTINTPDDIENSGIITYGDCSISGSGKLTVDLRDEYSIAINTQNGDLDINMTGALDIEAYDGIFTNGDTYISGSGDIIIDAKDDGILSCGALNTSGGTDIDISAGYNGLASYESIDLSGSGNTIINAGNYGIYCNYHVGLSGSGSVSVTSSGSGVYTHDGDVIISGSGNVNIKSTGSNAVYMYCSGRSLKLNGTGVPLSFTSARTYPAVFNESDGRSPVGGNNISYYDDVTGAPSQTSVIYSRIDDPVLIIDGHRFSEKQLKSGASGSGWYWNTETDELFLNNYNGGSISAFNDIVIILSAGSKNTVTVPSGSDDNGIYTSGNCVIDGKGSLNINAPGKNSRGIKTENGNADINITGDLNIRSGHDGIYSDDFTLISGKGSVDIISGHDAVSGDEGIEISHDGSINIDAGFYGITSYGFMNITNNGDLIIDSVNNGISSGEYVSLTVSGESAITAGNYGIYTYDGEVRLLGTGPVTVRSTSADAVFMYASGNSLLLNCTGYPLRFEAAPGYRAIRNECDNNSPVGGYYFERYFMTGAPEKELVIYDTYTSDLPFTDVGKTDWFYYDVSYAFKNSLMNGTSDTMFTPNNKTTRAMIVTILYRLNGSPTVSGGSSFEDVAAGMWYTDPVIWANQNGIVNGYSSVRFGPNDSITREQMATILFRYAGYKGYDLSASGDIRAFSDSDTISEYSIPAMKWAFGSGLINGTTATTLSPKNGATRAQIAAILHRFCEL